MRIDAEEMLDLHHLLADGFLPDLLEGLDLQVLGKLLQLPYVAAGELQKVSFVLDSRVSTVVLEELLDLLLLALLLAQWSDLEANFPSIGVKGQRHGGTARQNDHLRQLRVVAQRLGEPRAAGENFHLTHLSGYLQDDDGQAAQRPCRLLQGLLDLHVAGGTQLLAQPLFCDLLVAVELHMDDALVKACLFACLEKGEALAGLVIPPDQQGGAIMQVQQPADLGLDVLARDLHFGLGSVEGAVDDAPGHSVSIHVSLIQVLHVHCERNCPADSKRRGQCLASRANAIHHCWRRARIAT
mmetsp:Transcript_112844/g.158317  ORF Transcript_112844/g.158317 Transcript_112844/m.158317 type:complete len:298 (-) Transcript_112844:36-929(-)